MKTKKEIPSGGFLNILYKKISKKQLVSKPAKSGSKILSVQDILNLKNSR